LPLYEKRIGLIAMSGIRAQNAELLKLGLTLPGFVERSKVIASLPSLSLLTLAGMTPSHFEVEYMEIADLKSAPELPDRFDLVALTSLSAQIYEAYKVADTYRARGTPVVMGGLHVSSMPDEALEHCAAVVIGEGEAVWPEILADFERGISSLAMNSPRAEPSIFVTPHAALRFARSREIQSHHGANEPRLVLIAANFAPVRFSLRPATN
jgi:radical SAM superfamily enzyme YgiQ (UPF0313 family)